MQWWMRATPSRACIIAKPAPSSPSRLDCGTRTLRSTSSVAPPNSSPRPKIGSCRTISRPGVPFGTMTIECFEPPGSSSSVTPTTITILQSGWPAPEMNHLRPSMT